jgi:DNA primase
VTRSYAWRVPRIAPESIQAVRDGADLVELVRGRVSLTRRGGRWVGRCPFHEERTPSFNLLPPDSRRYYCHGCGATGDAFDWMQQQEGAPDFTEAVIALAERFGIELSYDEELPGEAAAREGRERRAQLLDRAAAFYAEYLWRADDAAPAREYLRARGIPEELIRRYRVGFAPGEGTRLSRRALRQGFTRGQLLDAGLARARGSDLADFFVGRITFPISDARGRVQGFGARTLNPDERAKYVNSPEGPNFHKRHLLFGLAEARAAAAKGRWVVVAEGYTDVLGLVAAGVDAAVACMGTSLTPEQLRLLSRWSEEVRLCFDADSAGQKAGWRTVEAAREVPLTLSAVTLPAGRDPGDLAADDDGRRTLADAVAASQPLLTSLIRLRAAEAGRSPRDREEALQDITSLLRNFPDGSLEKDEGVRLASGLLQLSQGVEARLRQSALRASPTPAAPTGRPAGGSPQEVRERRLLAMALGLPTESEPFLQSLSPEAFQVEQHRRAFELLRAGRRDLDDWPSDCARIAAELRVELAAGEPTEAELREAAYRLELPMLRRRATELRAAGDELGSLRALDLARRVEAALRGSE